jgi:hypothetical protein
LRVYAFSSMINYITEAKKLACLVAYIKEGR